MERRPRSARIWRGPLRARIFSKTSAKISALRVRVISVPLTTRLSSYVERFIVAHAEEHLAQVRAALQT